MNSHENFGRTIQLFLVDGKPNGLRKATIHGWTGIVLVSNQFTFTKLIEREEIDRTGIYILTGPDAEIQGSTRVYIGSANSVHERIKQSAEKREFWETAIAVVTSDDDLSKGHAEYLEARLIELTDEADRVILDNGTKPDTSRRRLPEADVANMEQFILNLKTILPVVGLEMLKPQPTAVIKAGKSLEKSAFNDVQFEIRHKSGVQAVAVEEDGEFIVMENSEALTGTSHSQHSYTGLKEKLVTDGILVRHGKDKLKFVKLWSFNSPSAAAAVVLDRSSNGRTEWKVKGSKLTYQDWQLSQAEKLDVEQ